MPRGNFTKMDDGTPLSFIQEAIFEKRMNNGRNYSTPEHNLPTKNNTNNTTPTPPLISHPTHTTHPTQKYNNDDNNEDDENDRNYKEPIPKPIDLTKNIGDEDFIAKKFTSTLPTIIDNNTKMIINQNNSYNFFCILLFSHY